MGQGTFKTPAKRLIASNCYTPIEDWIDISDVKDNEINLLVGDFGIPSIAFAVTTSSGSYSIDWGDSTVETGRVSGTTYSHTYTFGGGTYCSLGYYTYKIRIYGASPNFITRFQIKNTSTTASTPILRACFGTRHLTTLADGFMYCFSLKSVVFPSVMNSLASMSATFLSCYSLQDIKMPVCMNSLTTLANAFNSCYSLASLKLPKNLPSLTTMQTMCSSCYSLKYIKLPEKMLGLTTLASAFSYCSNLDILVFPSNLPNLTTLNGAFSYCNNLKKITLPTTTGVITTIRLLVTECFSLRSITLPTNIASVTDAAGAFQTCYYLSEIGNLSTLGSTSASLSLYNNPLSAFDGCYKLITDINLSASISYFEFKGTSNDKCLVDSIRLTNINTSSVSSTVVDIRYTSLGVAALELLFIDLPIFSSSKTINITGVTGCTLNSNYYSKTGATHTAGSTSVTNLSDTTDLQVGMEVTGTAGIGTMTTGVTLTTDDKVNKVAHGFLDGQQISFTGLGGATGLSLRTPYYIINKTDDNFELSLAAGGSKIDITGNSSTAVTFIYVPKISSIDSGSAVTLDRPAGTSGSSQTLKFTTVQRSIALLKGWTVTI